MIMLKKIIVIVIIVLVLLASLLVFPLLGFALGFAGIGLDSLIITCIFIFVWLLVLLVAIKFKSKALFNMYNYYWLTVSVVCFFVVGNLGILEGLAFVLFALFLTPIIGVDYLITSSTTVLSAVLILVALCLFSIGFFAKKKVLN